MNNSFMTLIVGLGNPGRSYKKTRHNLGFRVVDEFQKENNFPKFKLAKKFQAEVSESTISGQKIILAKPQTFMNNSGAAVKSLATYYKLQTTNLIVIHDDLVLPLGTIKISKGKGAGGHNGVASIIQELNTQEFIRMRIGAQSSQFHPSQNLKDVVLKKIPRAEKQTVHQGLKKTCQALTFLITQGAETAMNQFN